MSRYSAEVVADVVAEWWSRSESHAGHPHFHVEIIDLAPAVDAMWESLTLSDLMARGVKPGKVLVCSVKTRRQRWIHKSPGELRLESHLALEASRIAKTVGDSLALASQADEKALESRAVRVLRLIAKLTNGEGGPARPVERAASGHEYTVCTGCRGNFSSGERMIVLGSQRWHLWCQSAEQTATSGGLALDGTRERVYA